MLTQGSREQERECFHSAFFVKSASVIVNIGPTTLCEVQRRAGVIAIVQSCRCEKKGIEDS